MKLNLFKLMRISALKGDLEIGHLFQVILFKCIVFVEKYPLINKDQLEHTEVSYK